MIIIVIIISSTIIDIWGLIPFCLPLIERHCSWNYLGITYYGEVQGWQWWSHRKHVLCSWPRGHSYSANLWRNAVRHCWFHSVVEGKKAKEILLWMAIYKKWKFKIHENTLRFILLLCLVLNTKLFQKCLAIFWIRFGHIFWKLRDIF